MPRKSDSFCAFVLYHGDQRLTATVTGNSRGGLFTPANVHYMKLVSRPRDSTEEVWQYFLACQRDKTGEQKVLNLLELSRSLQLIAIAGAEHRGTGTGERVAASMKTIEELFRFVVSALDSAEISFMVVGSFASTFHGIPRATQDLDLVCDLNEKNLTAFLEVFSDPAFYFNHETATSETKRRGMFNLIHPKSGWKIDIIVRKDRDFSRREFDRRMTVELFGRKVPVATAEDTILSKLEWAKNSSSERQLRDVAEIIDTQGEALDRDYLDEGVRLLKLQEVFKRVKGPW